MAFNFPSSPTDEQIFNPLPGLYYRYGAATGRWETVPYSLYQSSGESYDNSRLPTALPYNYLVNPSFEVSQEYGDAVITDGGGLFPADQWHIQQTGVTGVNVQRVPTTTTKGSKHILRVTFTTAKVLAGAEYFGFVQYIEARRVAGFEMGTPRAKSMVLRFWVKGPAGTYGGGFRNGPSANRGISYSFTITAGQANTWVERVFKLQGDMQGTWVYGSELGMALWITFVQSVSTLWAFPGSWVNGNIIAPSATVNGAAVANNVFEIADVGLYYDPYNTGLPPPWLATPEHEALLDSQRYWWPCRNLYGASAGTYGPARGRAVCPTPMRTNPAVSIGAIGGHPCYGWDAAAMNPMTTIGNYSQTHIIECDCNSGAGYATGRPNQQLSEYPGYLAISARM